MFDLCRSSPTRESLKAGLGSVDARQASCSGRQAWPCTPLVTSSSLTMTTSGLASSPARASLRFVVCGCLVIGEPHRRCVTSAASTPHQAKLGSGRLMGPKGVSVDQNGHVIVVDNKACTVFIFQLTGKLITKFGSRGNGDKQFAGMDRSKILEAKCFFYQHRKVKADQHCEMGFHIKLRSDIFRESFFYILKSLS